MTWLSWSGLLLVIFLFFDFVLLSIWGYGGDWSPLWVAERLAWRDPAQLYNFTEVTKLQLPILGDLGVRPFVYPPSALVLLAPLLCLPFLISLAGLSIGGALGQMFVSSRRDTDRLLLILSPPVVFAAMIGQPTLLVATLAVWALSTLKTNEPRTGILLALAIAVKPTLLIMVPLGLVAGKHWRAIVGGAATAFLVIIASVILFGLTPWLGWIDALPRFREVFDVSAPLYRNGITLYSLALRMGFAASWMPYALFPAAALVTVVVFHRTGDWRMRMTAVVGGSLLVSPYAMNYELAALAPVVLTMRRKRLSELVIPLVWGVSLFANASLLGLLAVYLWMLFGILAEPRSTSDNGSVESGVDIPAREDHDGPLADGRLAA